MNCTKLSLNAQTSSEWPGPSRPYWDHLKFVQLESEKYASSQMLMNWTHFKIIACNMPYVIMVMVLKYWQNYPHV